MDYSASQSRKILAQLIYQLDEFSADELLEKFGEITGTQPDLGGTHTLGGFLGDLMESGAIGQRSGKFFVAKTGHLPSRRA